MTTGNACISSQVVYESLKVALHKAQAALTSDAARAYLDVVLAPLMQVTANEALDVQARWRFTFHDSLIVAGAIAALFLSEDLQPEQVLDNLTMFDPFR